MIILVEEKYAYHMAHKKIFSSGMFDKQFQFIVYNIV